MEDTNHSRLVEEERRRARQLRILTDLTVGVLSQDQTLDLEEARKIIRNTRRAAVTLFPGKEETFDLILLPRFERILYERWGIGMIDSVQ